MFALSATAAQSQEAVAPARTVVPTLGFSVGSMSIDADRAVQAQVGERAWGLQLDGGVTVRRFFFFGADIGGQFLDDHAEFRQNTTGGMKKSNASVTYFSATTGVRTGQLGAFTLGVNAGASATIGTRSIDNCSDSQVDKLKIPGGGFVEPMVLIAVRNFQVRLTDRVYLGGDGMQSLMSVGAQFALQKRR
jgi:hypothetical protein